MLQNTIEILNYVLFCCLVKPPLKELCIWEFCDLTAALHAKMHFVMETQHTDCSHHCKDFEGKNEHIASFFVAYFDTFYLLHSI